MKLETKPTKYLTYHDVPDDRVQLWSKRDPDNPYYQTRRWVNFKKKQIFFQQQDGIDHWKRTKFGKFMHYGIISSSIVICVYQLYYGLYVLPNKKKS